MGKNKFTQEQIDKYSKNEYVEKINKNQIIFTKEFKEICLRENKVGKQPISILNSYGIDHHDIGKRRIGNYFLRIRKQSKRPEGFDRKKSPGRPKNPTFDNLDDENRYLKEQLEYYKQENEFLKKLDELERQVKSKSQLKKNTK